jgi:hypothetical protein
VKRAGPGALRACVAVWVCVPWILVSFFCWLSCGKGLSGRSLDLLARGAALSGIRDTDLRSLFWFNRCSCTRAHLGRSLRGCLQGTCPDRGSPRPWYAWRGVLASRGGCTRCRPPIPRVWSRPANVGSFVFLLILTCSHLGQDSVRVWIPARRTLLPPCDDTSGRPQPWIPEQPAIRSEIAREEKHPRV